jgi:hypothetical protein
VYDSGKTQYGFIENSGDDSATNTTGFSATSSFSGGANSYLSNSLHEEGSFANRTLSLSCFVQQSYSMVDADSERDDSQSAPGQSSTGTNTAWSNSTNSLYASGQYLNGSYSFASLSYWNKLSSQTEYTEAGSNSTFSAYKRDDSSQYSFSLAESGSGQNGTWAVSALGTVSKTFNGTFTAGGVLSFGSTGTTGYSNSGTFNLAQGNLYTPAADLIAPAQAAANGDGDKTAGSGAVNGASENDHSPTARLAGAPSLDVVRPFLGALSRATVRALPNALVRAVAKAELARLLFEIVDMGKRKKATDFANALTPVLFGVLPGNAGRRLAAGAVKAKPSSADTEIAKAIDEVVQEMQQQKWVPANPRDAGAFGKEVHARVAQKLSGKKGWLPKDVFVRNGTNEILSIGGPPPGGTKGTTQIDVMQLEKGYDPKVGEILDHTKIKELYDIKGTLAGGLTKDQLRRLRQVRNGWPKILPNTAGSVKTVITSQRYTPSIGWHADPNFVTAIRVFSAGTGLLAVAQTANAMIHVGDYDDELDEIFQEAEKLRGYSDPLERKTWANLWLGGPVRRYLAHFIPDETYLNVAIAGVILKMWRDP